MNSLSNQLRDLRISAAQILGAAGISPNGPERALDIELLMLTDETAVQSVRTSMKLLLHSATCLLKHLAPLDTILEPPSSSAFLAAFRGTGTWCPTLPNLIDALFSVSTALPNVSTTISKTVPQSMFVSGSPTAYIPNPHEMIVHDLLHCPLLPHLNIGLPSAEPPSSRPFCIVETEKDLHVAMTRLSASPLLCIDVEHHSYHSYRGIPCLIQISTPTEDFILDLLSLSSLAPLGTLTANPAILKVFHGAEQDILWLQRDLGIFVVGMIDTHVAAREQRSLAGLAEELLGVKSPDKRMQTADWRIRPLSHDMTAYARRDTFLLLHVFVELNKRMNQEQIDDVFRRSSLMATKKMVHIENITEAAERLYSKQGKTLSEASKRVFFALFEWRDEIARQKDVSPGSVIPGQLLFKLADQLPTDVSLVRAVTKDRVSGSLLIEISNIVKSNSDSAESGDDLDEFVMPEPTLLMNSLSKSSEACPSKTMAHVLESFSLSPTFRCGPEKKETTLSSERIMQTPDCEIKETIPTSCETSKSQRKKKTTRSESEKTVRLPMMTELTASLGNNKRFRVNDASSAIEAPPGAQHSKKRRSAQSLIFRKN